jgi:multidrug efflux pump subunit AcrA (membrane-fusion protein)
VIDTFNSNEKTQENMKSALNDILDRIETQRKELRTQLADMDRKVEERVNAIKPAQQNVNGVSIQAQQEIQQAREATEKVTAEFQKKMEEAEKRHQEQTKAMQQQMQQMQQQMQQQVQQAQQQLQQAQQQSMDQARDTSENAEEESSGGGGGGGGGGSMNQETNQTVDAQLEMMMQIFMELFFGLDSLIVIFDDMDGMLGAWPGDIDMALMDVNDSMIEFETALIASNDGDITVISGL